MKKLLKKVVNKVRDEYITYQITPDSSVRNHRTEDFTKVVAGLWQTPQKRMKWFKDGSLLTIYDEDRVSFRVLYQPKRITFYVSLPEDKKNEMLRKLESIWPHATILRVKDTFPRLDPAKTSGAYLHYRKHDIMSLKVDHRDNYPLNSLLPAIRDLEEGDIAFFDALMMPWNRRQWEFDADKAYKKLEQGQVPTRPGQQLGLVIFNLFDSLMNSIRFGLLELTAVSSSARQQLNQLKVDEKRWSEGRRLLDEMDPESKKKVAGDVLQCFLRVAAQSDDPQRAARIVRTISNAWKDIGGDNELERADLVPKAMKQFLVDVENRNPIMVKMYANMMSTGEVAKLIQVPGDDLQKEFPEVEAVKVREVSLSGELFQEEGVRIGRVTEKGITRLAKIPVKAYEGVQLKAVYDALCTASFGQGKQGTGKSEGYGSTWAYDMVTNGFTVILIDTADGQMLRNFEDSLPEDYPEWKMIHLNCDNKAWPIALNWSDVLGREFKSSQGDDELQAVEMSERITSRFIEFVEGMASSEFTDAMKQYLTTAMKAVTTRKDWCFQDIELVLKSPSYREELLQTEKVKNMPEVVDDLRRLQNMAEKGSISSTVEGVLSRVRMLSNSKLLANMFYQPAKVGSDGKPTIDFRKWMDNEPVGDPVADKYGYCITIQASYDAWQDNQSLILGFFEDKINFNVFSRIEIDQGKRKPVLKWIDEPHKVIKSVAKYYKGSNVEFRKYRCKNLFTGHSIEQMGEAASSLLDGGAQITSYKTERLSEFEKFGHSFAPYEDPKELYASLAEKWEAVNKVRLPSGNNCPAFIAKMEAPPKILKDRSKRREECAREFGCHWKDVSKVIQDKRLKYQRLDEEWLEAKSKEREEEKEAEKEAKREAKAAERKEVRKGDKKNKSQVG